MKSITQHLLDRHVDLDLHKPVIDSDTYSATFYLYNLSGQLVGFQRYNPLFNKTRRNDEEYGKYFTHRDKTTHAVWGLESLHLSPNVLFVTEGIFDACRLTELGYSAVATLTNNPPWDLWNWFSFLNRKIVVVCDDDAAGRKLAKFGHYHTSLNGHDLGDASHEEVLDIIEKFR